MVGACTACASAATGMLARLGARLVTAAREKAWTARSVGPTKKGWLAVVNKDCI